MFSTTGVYSRNVHCSTKSGSLKQRWIGSSSLIGLLIVARCCLCAGQRPKNKPLVFLLSAHNGLALVEPIWVG